MLKHDTPTEGADNSDAPPGDEDQSKVISSDEETKSIRERIVSIRRKIHKATVNAVTARWNYEEGVRTFLLALHICLDNIFLNIL